VTWGSAPVTAAGGEYRLCWCAGEELGYATAGYVFWAVNGTNKTASAELAASSETPGGSARQPRCRVPSDFRVDAGRLYMLGPTPLAQHRTCVAGMSCAVDGLTGSPAGESNTLSETEGGPFQIYLDLADSRGSALFVKRFL